MKFGWDDLRHFLAFARAGSMQAAATALGVNQSTVQRRIAELEGQLGRRLVERHLSGYRLTELGEELRPAAEGVEAAVAGGAGVGMLPIYLGRRSGLLALAPGPVVSRDVFLVIHRAMARLRRIRAVCGLVEQALAGM